MANSVDPDQRSSVFWVHAVASILNLSVHNVRQLFAANDFSR